MLIRYDEQDEETLRKLFGNNLTIGLDVANKGYPKANDTERRITFKNPKIRIDEGKPEWGAEPGKEYFVISWERE